jgi:mRNA interferase MazF
MKHGDVVRVRLPYRRGRVQAGARPAVLMQFDDGPQLSPTLVVVPLTSQLAAARFSHSVTLESSEESGLRVRSIAMIYQVTAVDRANVVEQLGTLPDEEYTRIREALLAMITPTTA